MRGNEIDISIIVRNAILEELYEEKEIDEQMLAQTISGILKNGLRKEVEK